MTELNTLSHMLLWLLTSCVCRLLVEHIVRRVKNQTSVTLPECLFSQKNVICDSKHTQLYLFVSPAMLFLSFSPKVSSTVISGWAVVQMRWWYNLTSYRTASWYFPHLTVIVDNAFLSNLRAVCETHINIKGGGGWGKSLWTATAAGKCGVGNM